MKASATRIVYISLVISAILSASCNSNKKEFITLKNELIEIRFNPANGSLAGIQNSLNSTEILDEADTNGSLWEIEIIGNEGSEIIEMNSAATFTSSNPDDGTLVMEWSDFASIDKKELKVVTTVNLEKNKPMTNWSFSLEGTNGMNIKQIVYPRINGIKDIGNELLAVPNWLGHLYHNPREDLIKANESVSTNKKKRFFFNYPGPLSLQLMALYDINNYGLYMACKDTSAYSKSFSLSLNNHDNFVYELFNYPPMDSTRGNYTIEYESVFGIFKGDWMNAANIYKEWAEEQTWCKESRLSNDVIQPWLQKTGLWVWNRTTSDKVLKPAMSLKQKYDLPISVFWHWWHNCSYDEGFPEYLPPREGKNSFVEAMKVANENNIHAIVYMNSFQWGTETQSWKDEKAERFAVKDINGDIRSHVYNIFTGNSLTNMCMGTDFWRKKYASLSDSVINIYQTNGVYMDQACLNRRCYDKSHNHTIGGGNYWVNGFTNLTDQIREKTEHSNKSVLAGEGACEAWLPYLDAFLTLRVSLERFAGVSNLEPIPFFPMVYHKHALMYGSYSSLLVPPYEDLWPAEYAPKEPEALLSEDFNKQFLMEQSRSFIWGLQPTIANYRDFLPEERKDEIEFLVNLARVRMQSLKYLLYGEMLRSPKMEIPEEEIDISRLSIYAGKKGQSVTVFKDVVPLIYSGTWHAKDGSIGIALTNIGDNTHDLDIKFDASDYDLPPSGEVYLIGVEGKKQLGSYDNGEIAICHILRAKDICVLEINPN
ncbi:MAG: DUF6259 domain-containing protein [Bacteroidota bacterium]